MPASCTRRSNSELPSAFSSAIAARRLRYLLQERVNDEHPRVRLEAIRALSFFDSQAALDIAVESLIYDQDAYLEYTLKETMTTLEGRIKAGGE